MNFLGYDLFGTGSDASPCAGNPSLAGFVIQMVFTTVSIFQDLLTSSLPFMIQV